MSKRFNITRNYYNENEYIYDKNTVTFKEGVTVLIGCNGSGKTTLLQQINEKCENNNIPVLMFDNYRDGGSHSISKAGFYGDTNFLVQGLISSEGEIISSNISKFAHEMGRFVSKNKNAEKIFFLLDAIDSGYSIDNILETKRYLFDTCIKSCNSKGIEIYIIVSANEYEMANGENCLDISSLRYVPVPDYETYRNIIIETRKKKNKRYKWDEFDLS